MITALVGIAATIYIFRFAIGLFKPNSSREPAIGKSSSLALRTGRWWLWQWAGKDH